ncbi:MAG: hypothetical protein M1823_003257 [Watsoniomyces obsoletus]|nr:MAG: hypothetical protein M1823_003257 [Watsoniomyces obsoletus]
MSDPSRPTFIQRLGLGLVESFGKPRGWMVAPPSPLSYRPMLSAEDEEEVEVEAEDEDEQDQEQDQEQENEQENEHEHEHEHEHDDHDDHDNHDNADDHDDGNDDNDDDGNDTDDEFGLPTSTGTTPPGSPSPGWFPEDEFDNRTPAEVTLALAREELRADPLLSKSLPEPTNVVVGVKRNRSEASEEGEEEQPPRKRKRRPEAKDFPVHRSLRRAYLVQSASSEELRREVRALRGKTRNMEQAIRLQQRQREEVERQNEQLEQENARLLQVVERSETALRALQARLPELSGIIDDAFRESGEPRPSLDDADSPVASPEYGSPVNSRSSSRASAAEEDATPEARRRSRSRSPRRDRRPSSSPESDERQQRSYRTRSPPPTRRDRSPLRGEERGRSSARTAAQHPASPPPRSGSPIARTSPPSSRTRADRDEAPIPDGHGWQRTPLPTQHAGWDRSHDSDVDDVDFDNFWDL